MPPFSIPGSTLPGLDVPKPSEHPHTNQWSVGQPNVYGSWGHITGKPDFSPQFASNEAGAAKGMSPGGLGQYAGTSVNRYRAAPKSMGWGDAAALRTEGEGTGDKAYEARAWERAPDMNRQEPDVHALAGYDPALYGTLGTFAPKPTAGSPASGSAYAVPPGFSSPENYRKYLEQQEAFNKSRRNDMGEQVRGQAREVASAYGGPTNYDYNQNASHARNFWNWINRNTAEVPGAATNLAYGASGQYIPQQVKDFANTPLTSYVGLGDRRLRIADSINEGTGGALDKTLSPEIAGLGNLGTTPVELASYALPFLRAGRTATAARAAGAAETAAARTLPALTESAAARYAPAAASAERLAPALERSLPATTAQTAPAAAVAAEAATSAPAATSGLAGTLRKAITDPGLGQRALETASGVGALTSLPRGLGQLAKGMWYGSGTPTGRAAYDAARRAFTTAPIATAVPYAVNAAVPEGINKETDAGRLKRLENNPTDRIVDARGAVNDVLGGQGHGLLHGDLLPTANRVGLPFILGAGTVNNAVTGAKGPNLGDYFRTYWGNLGDLATSGYRSVPRMGEGLLNLPTQLAEQATYGNGDQSNELNQLKDINDKYREYQKTWMSRPDYLNNRDAYKEFENNVSGLQERAYGITRPSANVDLGRQLALKQTAYDRAIKETTDPMERDYLRKLYESEVDALQYRTPQQRAQQDTALARSPFVTGGDVDRGYWSLGMPSPRNPNAPFTPLNDEGRKNVDATIADQVRSMRAGAAGNVRRDVNYAGQDVASLALGAANADAEEARMNGQLRQMLGDQGQPAASVTRSGWTPESIARNAVLPDQLARFAMRQLGVPATSTQLQGRPWPGLASQVPRAEAVSPISGAEAPAGNETRQQDRAGENLTKIVGAAGGIGGALAAVNKSEPPMGFEKYWKGLDDSSKLLAIGGLSLAAITTLKNMFGSDDEDDEGFLSKVLPLLGVGAAAWGIGGGTFSKLPQMQQYRNFGDAVSNNVSSLFGNS